ncbi:MAG: hypothetical protein ACKPBB_09395 [Sphaerospermopsis kisseleviana]
MRNIKVGDIYWMPAITYIDKKSKDTKLVISKVGSKFIYAVKESTGTECKFTADSEGVLRLVDAMSSNKAYSSELWNKQKLIIELNNLTQKFRQKFPQIDETTDFSKYHEYIAQMQNLAQRILENA